MMVLRSATEADIDPIFLLAKQSGVGMTTLPKSKKLIAQRVIWSCESYKKHIEKADNEYYLFVLEDTQSKAIVGTSAIEARVGASAPFYSFKVSKRTRICHSLKIRSDYEMLSLVNDNQGHSEVCTLFLKPEYRKNNNGILLSKARFLFMAQTPQRFSSTVIAELRGVCDDKGRAPFWEHVGAHFFHMPFAKADRLTLATNKQFISDLMPRNPIYVPLLHEEAQAVIGKPHTSALPAITILLKEGFRYHHYVDIFDAGPTVEAQVKDIDTVKSSKVCSVRINETPPDASLYLLTNEQIPFRAVIAKAQMTEDKIYCCINQDIAETLTIQEGGAIRAMELP